MLPLPLFQPVISGRWAIALRALAAPALVGLDANMNGLRFPSLPQQLDFLINKPGTMLNRVENRFKLELNSWSPLLGGVCFRKIQTKPNRGRSATRLSFQSSSLTFSTHSDQARGTVKLSSWGRARRTTQGRYDGPAPKTSASRKTLSPEIMPAC